LLLPFLHKSFPALRPLTDDHRALAAELRRDIEILATDIGPRGVFAPDRYALCQHFLTTALRQTGLEITRHEFQASTPRGPVPCANLIATLPGAGPAAKRIIVLGAHYDSIEGCPAANDNASGVAGVLAIARRLAARARTADPALPRPTIRFLLFANEEPPFFNMGEMGSQEYARACRAANDPIDGMICLETIGCYTTEPRSQKWPSSALNVVLPTTGNFIALVGPSPAKDWIRRAAHYFERSAQFGMLAAAAPGSIDQINWSDHRGFNEAGYPAFMFTDTAPLRYAHYHEPTDTPDKLDYDSMSRVVTGIAEMLEALAAGEE
jgi:Peptidase family M28